MYVTWLVASWRERLCSYSGSLLPKSGYAKHNVETNFFETNFFDSLLRENPAKDLQLVIPKETQHMYIT